MAIAISSTTYGHFCEESSLIYYIYKRPHVLQRTLGPHNLVLAFYHYFICVINGLIILIAINAIIDIGITAEGNEIETGLEITGDCKYRLIKDFDLPANGKINVTAITGETQIMFYKN